MKPSTDTGRELSGNLTGERITMKIKAGAEEHLMGLLTDLYADRELAVLREYATNALDAHKAAGTPGPIQVSTPTQLLPVLTIRDFGVGLGADELREIYTQYGASTKRESNDETGMLGLGCKAALTYTEQFTLVAVKDGERVHASVTRNERGVGELTIVLREPADEPNGVTIQIPTERDNDFEAKAIELFSYWPKGSVELNGAEPARPEGLRLSDRLLIADNPDGLSDRVVMGGVPYPVTWAAHRRLGLPRDKRLIAYVEIGEVHFPPSREALLDTPTTKRTLEGLLAEYKAELSRAVSADIASAKTGWDALNKIVDWNRVTSLAGTALTWNGRDVPEAAAARYPKDAPARIRDYAYGDRDGIWLANTGSYRAKSATQFRDNLERMEWPRTVWIEDFVPSKFTSQHRAKLDAYATDNDLRLVNGPNGGVVAPTYVLLRGKAPAALQGWVDPRRILAWSDLRKIAVPGTGSGGGGNGVGSEYYKSWDGDAFDAKALGAALKAQQAPVFYFGALGRQQRWGEDLAGRRRARIRLLQELHPGCAIVQVEANRQEKFLRLVPRAQPAEGSHTIHGSAGTNAINLAWEKFRAGLSDAQWVALTTDARTHWLAKIDPERIDDPAVKAQIVEANAGFKDDAARKAAERRLALFANAAVRDANVRKQTWEPALAAYPLVDGSRGLPSEPHAILYMNAAYAAAQSKGK